MQTGADYSFDYLMEEGKPANIKKILAIYQKMHQLSTRNLFPLLKIYIQFLIKVPYTRVLSEENDTLACGQSSHKTTMNKRKCSLSLSPAETHCTARVAGGLLIIDHVL